MRSYFSELQLVCCDIYRCLIIETEIGKYIHNLQVLIDMMKKLIGDYRRNYKKWSKLYGRDVTAEIHPLAMKSVREWKLTTQLWDIPYNGKLWGGF